MMDRNLLMRKYRPTILSYTVHFCRGPHNVSKRMDQINREAPHSAATGARLKSVFSFAVLILSAFPASHSAFAQASGPTGSGPGVERVRLAAPDSTAAGYA